MHFVCKYHSKLCLGKSIVCFGFASIGKTAGSCGGDPFFDDGCVSWVPENVGEACVGQNSCTVSVQDDGTSITTATETNTCNMFCRNPEYYGEKTDISDATSSDFIK